VVGRFSLMQFWGVKDHLFARDRAPFAGAGRGKMNDNAPCDASAPRQFVTLRLMVVLLALLLLH
jgi:hypothetical protein